MSRLCVKCANVLGPRLHHISMVVSSEFTELK